VKIFKKETIQRFAGYMSEIVAAVLKNEEIKIKDIKVSHNLTATRENNPEIDFNF